MRIVPAAPLIEATSTCRSVSMFDSSSSVTGRGISCAKSGQLTGWASTGAGPATVPPGRRPPTRAVWNACRAEKPVRA